MVADKSLLVEHGPVAAEEAVLGRAGHQPVVVLDRQADVEDLSWRIKFFRISNLFFADLTSAGNVRIVAVVLALAGERVGIVRARWWGRDGSDLGGI